MAFLSEKIMKKHPWIDGFPGQPRLITGLCFWMNGETTDTTPKNCKRVSSCYQCRNYAIPTEEICCKVDEIGELQDDVQIRLV